MFVAFVVICRHWSLKSLKCLPCVWQMTANLLLYTCINLVSLYTKYLTDCAQRNAFLETRRSIETRYKIEKENGKQVWMHSILINICKCVDNRHNILCIFMQYEQQNKWTIDASHSAQWYILLDHFVFALKSPGLKCYF